MRYLYHDRFKNEIDYVTQLYIPSIIGGNAPEVLCTVLSDIAVI